jgi:hypothetical protein
MTTNLQGSVGATGQNAMDDVVKAQQWLLQHGLSCGRVDGWCGPRTVAAIQQFQADCGQPLDALITPGGATERRLMQSGQGGRGGNLRRAKPAAIRSTFEFWPAPLFYFPVLLYTLWLGLRYRGFMLPTVANPSIYSSGMVMESKADILRLIPSEQQQWVAPWVAFGVPAPSPDGPSRVEAAMAQLAAHGLSLPIVAKPDVGQRGEAVQPIYDRPALQAYLDQAPSGMQLILQKLVPWPNEAGVFYYRWPDQARGQIFSITLKQFPTLCGDGQHTLGQLIERDPRARLQKQHFFQRHAARLDQVLANGQVFPLVFAGNHCQGSIFRDGAAIETPVLLARIDDIAARIPGFYFGRFDIRFESIDALRRGEALQIVELNGAGAEATHIWAPDTRLFDAWRTLFRQFHILYRIGAHNRKCGHRPLPLRQLLRDLQSYAEQARHYPGNHPGNHPPSP